MSGEGIRSNPAKVEVVENWKSSNTKKELLRFLGFAVFYHKYISNLSGKAKLLYSLLKKDVPYDWQQEHQAAFDKLKQELVRLPTLAYPNSNLPYDLHCDAFDTGLGSYLVRNGRPIAFASRTLSSAEINYGTTEKECLSIVRSLQHFHPYVYGANLCIYTDHMALKAILSTKLPRGRIARWIMALQDYQPYTIIHKKGIDNADSDALSRLSQNNQEVDAANLSVESFQTLQKEDPHIILLMQTGISDSYKWCNGILRIQEGENVLPVVPVGLVKTILKHMHGQETGSHFWVDKTLDNVKTIGWWATRKQDVIQWVKHCQGCQRFKIRTDSQIPPMQSITPSFLGEIWAADIAVLPESRNKKRYVLVLMEYLSKWAVTAALDSFDTDHILQVLLYKVVLKVSLPSRLITDNGSSFISEAMNMVCKRLNIRISLTSVEHPQSDGLVERINRSFKTSLGIIVDKKPNEWDEFLPFITLLIAPVNKQVPNSLLLNYFMDVKLYFRSSLN